MAAGLGFKTFTTGEVLTAADTNGYLMQGVLVFASSAARSAAITSPQEGQYSYLKDTNSTEYYDGAAWIAAPIGDITGVTAGTGISGGGTSGTVTITNSMATEITAKGDLIAGTGSATFDNLPVGTNGQTLVANSSTSTGLEWQTPSSGTPAFVGVGVKKSANQSIANATFTAITFNQEDFDTNAFHDTSTNNTRITTPAGKAGYYAIAGTIVWSGNGTGNRGIELQKNGASLSYMNFLSAPATNDGAYSMSYILNLAVSDYVELFGYQTSGGALNIISAGTSWQMQYLGA